MTTRDIIHCFAYKLEYCTYDRQQKDQNNTHIYHFDRFLGVDVVNKTIKLTSLIGKGTVTLTYIEEQELWRLDWFKDRLEGNEIVRTSGTEGLLTENQVIDYMRGSEDNRYQLTEEQKREAW